MTESTFSIIQQIIIDRFGVEEEKITPDFDIKKDLGADSLDIVELVMELEDRFAIQIDDEEVDNIVAIGDIVNYIDAKK